MSKLSQEQKAAWLNHLDAQRQSGLGQQAYCEQQSLKPHRYRYWYWYWKNKLEGSTKTYKKSKPQGKFAGHSGFVLHRGARELELADLYMFAGAIG